MTVLGRRIKALAITELFGGVAIHADNRLVLDYIVPVIEDGQEHQINLVVRLGYEENGKPVVGTVKAKIRFLVTELNRIRDRDMFIEVKAQSLVSSMKNGIGQMNNPVILLFPEGDMTSSPPNMKRIWL